MTRGVDRALRAVVTRYSFPLDVVMTSIRCLRLGAFGSRVPFSSVIPREVAWFPPYWSTLTKLGKLLESWILGADRTHVKFFTRTARLTSSPFIPPSIVFPSTNSHFLTPLMGINALLDPIWKPGHCICAWFFLDNFFLQGIWPSAWEWFTIHRKASPDATHCAKPLLLFIFGNILCHTSSGERDFTWLISKYPSGPWMGTDREGGKMELDYDSAVKCRRCQE